MYEDSLIVSGIDKYQEALTKLQTDNPRTRRELQAIIRKAIAEARKNIVKDAQSALDNDPRHAYKAVRNSVYKQILGGQVNIISSRKRGAATQYQRPRELREGQRGGNRRQRSKRTMQIESYEGKDRGFILRFQNAGTVERETRYGKRGAIRARNWFGLSSTYQIEAAAVRVDEEIEKMLQREFNQI